MPVGRVFALIITLAAIALIAVGLRSEQTRLAAQLLKLESRWVELRRERWALQTRAARLRAPNRIRELLVLLPMHLRPVDSEVNEAAVARLAANRPRE